MSELPLNISHPRNKKAQDLPAGEEGRLRTKIRTLCGWAPSFTLKWPPAWTKRDLDRWAKVGRQPVEEVWPALVAADKVATFQAIGPDVLMVCCRACARACVR